METDIKITVYHLVPVKLAKILKSVTSRFGDNVEKQKLAHRTGRVYNGITNVVN